jgi:hypothetical protein
MRYLSIILLILMATNLFCQSKKNRIGDLKLYDGKITRTKNVIDNIAGIPVKMIRLTIKTERKPLIKDWYYFDAKPIYAKGKIKNKIFLSYAADPTGIVRDSMVNEIRKYIKLKDEMLECCKSVDTLLKYEKREMNKCCDFVDSLLEYGKEEMSTCCNYLDSLLYAKKKLKSKIFLSYATDSTGIVYDSMANEIQEYIKFKGEMFECRKSVDPHFQDEKGELITYCNSVGSLLEDKKKEMSRCCNHLDSLLYAKEIENSKCCDHVYSEILDKTYLFLCDSSAIPIIQANSDSIFALAKETFEDFSIIYLNKTVYKFQMFDAWHWGHMNRIMHKHFNILKNNEQCEFLESIDDDFDVVKKILEKEN